MYAIFVNMYNNCWNKLFSALKWNNFNLKHKTCICTSYINSVKVLCNLPLGSVTRY